jgi:hypothetical protein
MGEDNPPKLCMRSGDNLVLAAKDEGSTKGNQEETDRMVPTERLFQNED